MTPEEVLLLLKEAADAFTAISGKPADNDLTRVEKVIYPLLLSVTYDQVKVKHNLRGIITPSASYSKTYGSPFPIPKRPSPYSTSIKKDATDGERRGAEAVYTKLSGDLADPINLERIYYHHYCSSSYVLDYQPSRFGRPYTIPIGCPSAR